MGILGWYSLQERRAKLKLYKILNNLCIIENSDPIPTNSPRRSFSFLVPRSMNDQHLYSIFLSTIRLWNHMSLPFKILHPFQNSRMQLKSLSLLINIKSKLHPTTLLFSFFLFLLEISSICIN